MLKYTDLVPGKTYTLSNSQIADMYRVTLSKRGVQADPPPEGAKVILESMARPFTTKFKYISIRILKDELNSDESPITYKKIRIYLPKGEISYKGHRYSINLDALDFSKVESHMPGWF